MKLVICASINFTNEIKQAADELTAMGHVVEIPKYTQKILAGDLSLEEFVAVKEAQGDLEYRQKSEEDLIKKHHRLIKEADAILVLNIDKKGIKNYIGANTFLEIGFAHVLDKKIFLFNEIPDMMHRDEVLAIEPVVLNGNLDLIK
ncbi:hypothetical protein HQ571_03505 [Candidatus Kuenenbacteria bacterium]|nr:hypothetical protein [Candidatus Kuenenbacteria bacterium]